MSTSSSPALLEQKNKRLRIAGRVVPAVTLAVVVVTLSLSISVATNDKNAIANGGFDGYNTESMRQADIAVIVLASFAIALIIATFVLNLITTRRLERSALAPVK